MLIYVNYSDPDSGSRPTVTEFEKPVRVERPSFQSRHLTFQPLFSDNDNVGMNAGPALGAAQSVTGRLLHCVHDLMELHPSIWRITGIGTAVRAAIRHFAKIHKEIGFNYLITKNKVAASCLSR